MTTPLTPAEVAGRLGKTAEWWRKQAKAKRIPHHRLGRTVAFTEDDLEEILAQSKVAPFDPLRTITDRSRQRAS